MGFMDFLEKTKNADSSLNCDYAREFKDEFDKLFDNDNSIQVFEKLRKILENWKRDCPRDENLVYADIILNIHSLNESDIKNRIDDVKPLQATDRKLHSWYLSAVFVILAVYLDDDLRQLYPKTLKDQSHVNEFSQKISQKFNDELFKTLLDKSYDDEDIAINSKILHVTVYSKYLKYANLKCDQFACEFEKIMFTSYNNKSPSEDLISEFRVLSEVWEQRCPDDANMACAYIVSHVMDLSDDELEYYQDLANNGTPVDESRNFILKRSMIGALKVRNGNANQKSNDGLDCRDYARKFKELYEKIFEDFNGNEDDNKQLADLLFSWDSNCPDDANVILARTLMFHSSLNKSDIMDNISKVRESRPVDRELYGWFLEKTLKNVFDEETSQLIDMWK